MSVEFLKRSHAPALAYQKTSDGKQGFPTVLFLHGFRSDMEGTKAQFLSESCPNNGQGFIRFDCRGHGKSEGVFEDSTIGDWIADTLSIIDEVAKGPLILVGSSMGGWLSLHAALARPNRVSALVGLAAAPDFTRDIKNDLNPRQLDELKKAGRFFASEQASDFPLIITQKLLDEGEDHCLLDGPINITCPVRLIQGMKDDAVPWQHAHRLANAITGTDKKVYLREEGDHRLSTPEDLALLETVIQELSGPE